MSNNRPLLILAIIVLAIVGGSLWFLNNNKVPVVSATPPADINVPVGPQAPVAPRLATPAPEKPATAAQPVKPAATPKPLQDWEMRIDDVLRSSADEAQTAQILINLLPTLPPEGQEEAAQHISNLTLDDAYKTVLPLVKNPNLPEPVLDVLVTDLMNRDDTVKLPALLEIAKTPNHPHHEEALTDLQIFLDEDFGNDFSRWEQAMNKYLKEQAAENAPDTAPAPEAGAVKQ